MSPQLFKKLMIEAYLAGAESMICGCLPMQTKKEAREWFEENHQLFDESDEDDGRDTEVL
jgi:disulfide oxidoreductase YuzD